MPPPTDNLKREGPPVQLPAGVIAQGWRAEDDAYFEEIRAPSGVVVWYPLRLND
jgi:hypothetical protein